MNKTLTTITIALITLVSFDKQAFCIESEPEERVVESIKEKIDKYPMFRSSKYITTFSFASSIKNALSDNRTDLISIKTSYKSQLLTQDALSLDMNFMPQNGRFDIGLLYELLFNIKSFYISIGAGPYISIYEDKQQTTTTSSSKKTTNSNRSSNVGIEVMLGTRVAAGFNVSEKINLEVFYKNYLGSQEVIATRAMGYFGFGLGVRF